MNQLTLSKRTELEQVDGIIFDIQRYSVHDGPGLRTNVFFKGCPLRCRWCANPESLHPQPEIALFVGQCINCGQFAESCPELWQQVGAKERTEVFQERIALCPTEAIHWIGKRRTAGEVMQEVLRDRPFYGDGGGLTLTGGEPTMQPQMAEAMLRLAKAESISTAMETCGYTSWQTLERLLPYLDIILWDLKHVDDDIHRKFTGVSNKWILANLRRLSELDAPVTIRIPLIPGFNASTESITRIAEFVQHLSGAAKRVDLLPYHTLGKPKYAALQRLYPWEAYQRLTDAEVETLAKIFEDYGLHANIGG